MRSSKELKRDFRWGLVGALSIAGVYCTFVGVLYLIRGSEVFDRHETTIGEVILSYVVIAAVAGIVVGVLRPLTQSRTGAYVVGIFTGFPIATGITIGVKGPPKVWDEIVWIGLPIFSILVGVFVGFELWHHLGKRRVDDLA